MVLKAGGVAVIVGSSRAAQSAAVVLRHGMLSNTLGFMLLGACEVDTAFSARRGSFTSSPHAAFATWTL